MPENEIITATLVKTPSSKTYQTLLDDIAQLYTQAQASVVRMYWKIGRRIVEVEQEGDAQAAYGEGLTKRLSVDLTERLGSGFSLRNLQRMRRFYLQQKMAPAPARLSWSHQIELMSIRDARARKKLAIQVLRRNLSTDELRALIRNQRKRVKNSPSTRTRKHSKSFPQELLTPNRGTPGLFRIKDISGALYWDFGFESYRELTIAQARSFKDGDMVRMTGKGAIKSAPDGVSSQLYTYQAQLLRVVDGDTLWMLIRLGGSDWRREKLRLRGIDTPELGTPAGAASKRYVQRMFQKCKSVLISTTKPDKWDRYLSDIFVTSSSGKEVFLNNRLLETKHARLYYANSPQDWEV